MEGWNLKEGKYIKTRVVEDEFWSIINNIFSSKTQKTTTYKYCFFKCLLDNLFNVDSDLTLDFEKVFERFTEIYWNLVTKYSLAQAQKSSRWEKSSVENIIEDFIGDYKHDYDFPFESLRNDLSRILVKNVSKVCSEYVIGAFYGDSKQSFYSFSKKDKKISFNPDVYYMLTKYKNVIEKLNYYEWIKFLEKINPKESSYAIAEKLDNSSKRNNLSLYREYLKEEYGQIKCFYCSANLKNRSTEVDHYIPWSFVKDDKLWNFVLSCRTCNNKKRDKLPAQTFNKAIIVRNSKILRNPRTISIVNYDFKGYTDNKIIRMFDSAVFNGFEYGWEPKYMKKLQ